MLGDPIFSRLFEEKALMMSPVPKQRRVALKLLLLLLVCLAPVIGAVFLYQARDTMVFASKNQGTLIIPPISLDTLGVELPTERRWWLTYYTPKACDEACQAVLNHFNTIELSLAKDAPRLGTLLLSPNPINQASMPAKPVGLVYKQTNPQVLPPSLQPSGIWLIDPLGNIILRYDADKLDNRMLLDLRYLLKVSQIG